MNDIRQRLNTCFATVFPALRFEEIESASTSTVTEWDSLASVTLASVVEEEFAVHFDLDEIEALTSFERLYAVLSAKNGGHRSD